MIEHNFYFKLPQNFYLECNSQTICITSIPLCNDYVVIKAIASASQAYTEKEKLKVERFSDP